MADYAVQGNLQRGFGARRVSHPLLIFQEAEVGQVETG
jgi:hypothetical protein